MSTLEQHADRVRVAVSSGDFCAASAALNAYANEVQRIARSDRRQDTLAGLELHWKDLAQWVRSMALTARELARDEWGRLPVACPYRAAADRPPSMISTRG